MSTTIICEFSDYRVQSTEFFLDGVKDYIVNRDLSGLTNAQIKQISFAKEHPIITLMSSMLAPGHNADTIRANLIPTISVTPGDLDDQGFTLANAPQVITIDDEYIAGLKECRNLSLINRFKDVLITDSQIDTIISAYKRAGKKKSLRCESREWSWNEKLNLSVWAESIDDSILMSTLADSALIKIKTGIMGDNSPMRNLSYRPARGLTNFNFGRVLYGSEFNLTFLNTYKNYTIYEEPTIGTDVILNGTFTVPNGE